MNIGSKIKTNRIVMKTDVKLCALCGTLNHTSNSECYTCGWHGAFSKEAQTIELAWLRLDSLYEEVRMEHVTSKRMRIVDDFGTSRPVSFFRRLTMRIASSWDRLQTLRELRSAQRASSMRSNIPSPHGPQSV